MDESEDPNWIICWLLEICDIINSGGRKKEQEIWRIKREKETEEDRRRRRWEKAEELETVDVRAPAHYNDYKFFFALALTRLSNTVLRIGVCAVWNGFIAVCAKRKNLRKNQK